MGISGAPEMRRPERFGAFAVILLMAGMLFLGVSCQTAPHFSAILGDGLNRVIDGPELRKVTGGAVATVSSLAREPSPEQEYYIGRSVGARILDRYRVWNDPEYTKYLNLLGQGLALHSTRPEIYKGYRFLVLDTLEIQAFATPGGHVFVSRAMLAEARTEDELAAILAHEISHIALRHGMASIKSRRFALAAAALATETGKAAGGDIAALAEAFGDSIEDITSTLVVSGYSRYMEFEADRRAFDILKDAAYDPEALERFLRRLDKSLRRGRDGFAATHPEPGIRVASLVAYRPSAMTRQQPEGSGDPGVSPAASPTASLAASPTISPTRIADLRAERFLAAMHRLP